MQLLQVFWFSEKLQKLHETVKTIVITSIYPFFAALTAFAAFSRPEKDGIGDPGQVGLDCFAIENCSQKAEKVVEAAKNIKTFIITNIFASVAVFAGCLVFRKTAKAARNH